MSVFSIIIACVLPLALALVFFACAVFETAQAHKQIKQQEAELVKLIGRKHF